MYARYRRTRSNGVTSYRFVEKCCLFGCNEGFIPWLLGRQVPASQGEPYRWHLSVQDAMDGATENGTDYTGSTLIIDLKPKQKTNLSLYEVMDVWGYSSSGWTPILLHLSGLFVDANPNTTDCKKFGIADEDRDEPIYEFMYLDGSVQNGRLVGRWNAPPASPTNAALLWPESLAYFFQSIRQRTPAALEQIPPNPPLQPTAFGGG